MSALNVRTLATKILTCTVLFIPYSLGLILSRPASTQEATQGFFERSLIFFLFFLFIHLLYYALTRLYLKEEAAKIDAGRQTDDSNRSGKKGRKNKKKVKNPKKQVPDTPKPAPKESNLKQAAKVITVLALGGASLFLLAFAERHLYPIKGATTLLMILFGLFPLLSVLTQRKAWALYIPLVILTQILVAFTSLVVHFADSMTTLLYVGLLTFSLSEISTGIGQLLPLIMFSIAAGALGSVGSIYLTLPKVKDQIWIKRFDSTILVLLFIPPPVIAILGQQQILPAKFMLCYLALGFVIVLTLRFRDGNQSKPGFHLAALFTSLLVYISFILIGFA